MFSATRPCGSSAHNSPTAVIIGRRSLGGAARVVAGPLPAHPPCSVHATARPHPYAPPKALQDSIRWVIDRSAHGALSRAEKCVAESPNRPARWQNWHACCIMFFEQCDPLSLPPLGRGESPLRLRRGAPPTRLVPHFRAQMASHHVLCDAILSSCASARARVARLAVGSRGSRPYPNLPVM